MPILLLAALAVQQPAAPVRREIAVERRLADSLRVGVGDTVRLAATADGPRETVRIAAVYEPAPDPATVLRPEFRIRLHLPDAGELLGRPDRVDRIGVALAPGADPDAAVAALNETAFGFRAHRSSVVAGESSQTFAVVSRFHDAIAAITIVASAIFLLCIMLLKVEERRLDAAVMRFVGVRRRTIFLAVVIEAAIVALGGAAIGAVLAAGASWAVNGWYQRVYATALVFSHVTPGLVAFAVALSLALGLGAGALAALRLVRTRPLVLWGRA